MNYGRAAQESWKVIKKSESLSLSQGTLRTILAESQVLWPDSGWHHERQVMSRQWEIQVSVGFQDVSKNRKRDTLLKEQI